MQGAGGDRGLRFLPDDIDGTFIRQGALRAKEAGAGEEVRLRCLSRCDKRCWAAGCSSGYGDLLLREGY